MGKNPLFKGKSRWRLFYNFYHITTDWTFYNKVEEKVPEMEILAEIDTPH